MSVAAKICGLSTPETVAAAVQGGARFVGFVFYPPSPRSVTPEQAARLAAQVPSTVTKVGLFVDPDDAMLEALLRVMPLDMLQLHGKESPDRAAAIRERFRRPVMKALRIGDAQDVAAAEPYLGRVDRLLFDARPPALPNALPGGNGVPFDWSLLAGRHWPLPWMLSGGLDAGNLTEAVRVTGAEAVDVSSGVETSPGIKDIGLIRTFLETTRRLG
jgi:phosphoribosylanthranilate isomerase